MATFAEEDRREFARNGFLVRDDLLSSDLLDRAYYAVRNAMDVDPDDPSQLLGRPYNVALEGINEDPIDEIIRALFPVVDELVGEGSLAMPNGGMQVALDYPTEDAADLVPEAGNLGGHVDGYACFDKDPEVTPFTVGVTVYLNDVRPRTGGFTVWPGTHRVAAKYFEDHALETVGGGPTSAELPAVGDEPGEWDYDRRLYEQFEPYEIAGDAGTVVIWHSRLTHDVGINRGEDVRIAALKRFSRENEDETMRDAAPNLFKYWPAMEDVPLVKGGDPVTCKRDWL